MHGDMRNANNTLVEKSEGKMFCRPRFKFVDIIKMVAS
jgi:hypothetical protein